MSMLAHNAVSSCGPDQSNITRFTSVLSVTMKLGLDRDLCSGKKDRATYRACTTCALVIRARKPLLWH